MKRILAWFCRKPTDPGLWGEWQAERYLRRRGYRIHGRRVRVGDRDELDLVAQDGDSLVFVEVKTRGSESFGRPVEAVGPAKRHTLSRAAVRYLKRLRRPPRYFRFDVVEVVGSPVNGVMDIRHLENVFSLQPPYEVPY